MHFGERKRIRCRPTVRRQWPGIESQMRVQNFSDVVFSTVTGDLVRRLRSQMKGQRNFVGYLSEQREILSIIFDIDTSGD